MLYFGTAGIRAKINELTPKEAYEIGLKLSGYFGKNIVIGRDVRINSLALFDAIEASMLYTGKKITSLEVCPTPTLQYYLEKNKLDGGFMITASHNPPEWNGIKIFRNDNITLPKEEGNEMLKNPKIPEFSPSNNKEFVDGNSIHAKALEVFDIFEGDITIDYGNGVASLVFSKFLNSKKANIKTINEKLDGTFPGRNSEPVPKNLGELMNRDDYEVGIAFDGDGDRVVFIDDKREFIGGDRTLAIISKYLLEKEKGTIVSTVATSKMVDDVVKDMGGNVIHTKVGTTYIAQAIKKNNAILGGEEAGGVIYPKIHLGKDGLLTAAFMLHIIKEKGKKLSELNKEIPYYYFEKRKISIDREKKKTFISKFYEYVKEVYKDGKFNLSDGIRIDFEDYWILIRPSGTEDKIRYFVEAKNKEKALKIMEELEEELRRFIS